MSKSGLLDKKAIENRQQPVQGKACRIREMTADDLPEVVRVEANCYDFPWSLKIFNDCRESGYTCVVVESEVDPDSPHPSSSCLLVGHGVMMFGPGEAHILNLCVVAEQRRLGVARQLLTHLITLASQRDTNEVFLEVRESNFAAIRLYESMGFNQIAIRPRYYDSSSSPGGREDAMIYALTLY